MLLRCREQYIFFVSNEGTRHHSESYQNGSNHPSKLLKEPAFHFGDKKRTGAFMAVELKRAYLIILLQAPTLASARRRQRT
jgi:hypothetical protein